MMYFGIEAEMEIKIDDLKGSRVAAFLDAHIRDMKSVSALKPDP